MTPPARLLHLHRNSLTSLLLIGGNHAARLEVARAFHSESPVRHGRLVVVDARTEGASLFEALEAWLAAEQPIHRNDPIGKAEGGTLFLDGIEALGLSVQRMLLAFSKQYCDADGEKRWFGRLAAGSDRPLCRPVSEGRFSVELLDALDKVRVDMRWSRRDVPIIRERPSPGLGACSSVSLAKRHQISHDLREPVAPSWNARSLS